jgi:hypothetical protein
LNPAIPENQNASVNHHYCVTCGLKIRLLLFLKVDEERDNAYILQKKKKTVYITRDGSMVI